MYGYTFPIGPLPHEVSPSIRPVPYGAWGATDAEIDAAIQFGPVAADDPARAAAGAAGGAASGAAAGAILGPIGAILGAVAGAAPQILGLVQSIQAKRGSLAGLMKQAAKVRASLATARRPAKKQKLLNKYEGLLQQIQVEKQNIAMLEAQAAAANMPVPPPQPPYALYAVTGIGLVALIGGGIYLLRRK
jgi:hypothetical protein